MNQMRLATAGLAACVLLAVGIGSTRAQQRAPIQAAPLPPLQRQWQQEAVPPGSSGRFSRDNPGGGSGPGFQDRSQPSPSDTYTQPPITMERPNVWLPAKVARLQALDKVNAQSTPLTIKVGQSAAIGSLTITVKACVVRPPDQPADAAAFLDVTDSHADQPGFKGWILETEPAVSMMQHPIYDLRITGCA